jgi:hypothetical protein
VTAIKDLAVRPHIFMRYGEWRYLRAGVIVYRRLTAAGVAPFGERLSDRDRTRQVGGAA